MMEVWNHETLSSLILKVLIPILIWRSPEFPLSKNKNYAFKNKFLLCIDTMLAISSAGGSCS